MTPAQVEQAARRRYNSENSTFWSQDEVLKVIYEAECILAIDTLCVEETNTIATVIGTQSYNYPQATTIGFKRISYNGTKLKPITMREDDLLTLSNSATTQTGTPAYYYLWDRKIYLRPTPDAVGTLSVLDYQMPALLDNASTALSVPIEHHFALIDYVCSIMAAKDENIRMATFYTQKWEKGLIEAARIRVRRKRSDAFAMVQDEESFAETIIGSV